MCKLMRLSRVSKWLLHSATGEIWQLVVNEALRAVTLRTGPGETMGRLRSSRRGEGSVWFKGKAIPRKIHLNPPPFMRSCAIDNIWVFKKYMRLCCPQSRGNQQLTQGWGLMHRKAITHDAEAVMPVSTESEGLRTSPPSHSWHRWEGWGPEREGTRLRNHREPVKFSVHAGIYSDA